MKTMKRFAARICALFVVLTVSLTALVPAAFAATKAQLPDLPSSQCVVDDANILSSSTKTAIENLNAQLTEQCEGAQIGVLTVDYTGSLSTEDYAVQLQQKQRCADPAGHAVPAVRRWRLLPCHR